MAAIMALAAALDMNEKGTASALHRVAREIEERLIAMADVIPELSSDETNKKNKGKANNASMGASRQPLAA